jgi:hypothetical protein
MDEKKQTLDNGCGMRVALAAVFLRICEGALSQSERGLPTPLSADDALKYSQALTSVLAAVESDFVTLNG